MKKIENMKKKDFAKLNTAPILKKSGFLKWLPPSSNTSFGQSENFNYFKPLFLFIFRKEHKNE